jgi:hypothetical protein
MREPLVLFGSLNKFLGPRADIATYVDVLLGIGPMPMVSWAIARTRMKRAIKTAKLTQKTSGRREEIGLGGGANGDF